MAFNFNTLEAPFITSDKSGSFVVNNAIGVTLPFNTEGGGVFNKSYFSDEQMRSNVINLLSTKKGERLYHIDFGTDLHKFLFEQITETGELEAKIRSSLVTAFDFWTPYVVVKNVDIRTPAPEAGKESRYALKIRLDLEFDPTQSNIQVIIFIDNQGTLIVE